MFKKKVIAFVLVVALVLCCAVPVSAAYVSEDISPSGVIKIEDSDPEFVALPDRTRYTFTFDQPVDNYYWGTWYRLGQSYRWSYDFGSNPLRVGGKATSSESHVLEVYPAGRAYYLLPFDPYNLSDFGTLFSVTVPVRTETVKVTSSEKTTTYKTGSYDEPTFDFRFYDKDFNLITYTSGTCTLASTSGESSADSYGLATYTFSMTIPENAVYVVPCLKFSQDVKIVRSDSTSYNYSTTRVSLGMSWSICFELMTEADFVDGVWQFYDNIPANSWYSHEIPVNFTCDGVNYTGLKFYESGSNYIIQYLYPGGAETVYSGTWYGDSKKTVDFGSVPQAVPIYSFGALLFSAERIGDSPTDNTGSISIKDYSGSIELFDLDSVKLPCTVAVESNGLSFTYSGDDTVSYFYEFGGTGNFVGCSLVPNDIMTRYTHGRTFTLTSSSSIYLHIEGDVSPDQPDDPDPSDPTDPVDPSEPDDNTDPTVPTDPGDSGTDSDGSGSGESADDLHGIGNGAVDDLTGAIPDYSEGFILALQDFAGAFSYEGTACSFTLPAVTMPAISDLVPKFELFPSTEFDIEPLFDLFPSRILLLVRSLLTGGLIVYCFKELYDTVSYFMTLKKGE